MSRYRSEALARASAPGTSSRTVGQAIDTDNLNPASSTPQVSMSGTSGEISAKPRPPTGSGSLRPKRWRGVASLGAQAWLKSRRRDAEGSTENCGSLFKHLGLAPQPPVYLHEPRPWRPPGCTSLSVHATCGRRHCGNEHR